MSIEDLLVYFEQRNEQRSHPSHNLRFDDHGAFGCYNGLWLHSAFQAVFAADTLRVVAHEALLRARDENNQPISPAEVFKRAVSPDEVVYLDRLSRVVHALNFFNQSGTDDDLYLNVSGRHLLGVSGNHGRTFETLLRHCGLQPRQIVLEILESRVDDLSRLQEALDAYRSRGFRVAIDDFGCQNSNFDRLWRLTPDIVKLDRELILQASDNSRARRILPKIIEIIHDLGAQVVCEGIETALQHALARDAGADLLQGYYYAKPTAQLVTRVIAGGALPDSRSELPVSPVQARYSHLLC